MIAIHPSKKINIKLKTVLSKKIIQLGFTKSGSCLAVNSCGTWDLELITLCLIFPSEKWNNILPSSKLSLNLSEHLFVIHSAKYLKGCIFSSHCPKWWGRLFPYIPTKNIRLERPNYKILRLKTDKIIKAVLWESFTQTNILQVLGRIDCL